MNGTRVSPSPFPHESGQRCPERAGPVPYSLLAGLAGNAGARRRGATGCGSGPALPARRGAAPPVHKTGQDPHQTQGTKQVWRTDRRRDARTGRAGCAKLTLLPLPLISFPGGLCDKGETPVEAAVRETWEELGIRPSAVNVLGVLTELPDGVEVSPSCTSGH